MNHQPALRIDSLKFRYHRRRKSEPWVIDIPALELHRGEQMLLTAGSGHGKSTLLHLICGLMDPVQGETYVDGTPIHSMQGAARDLFRGKRIGMIFQSFNLLHGFSALDNVMAAMMFSTIPRNQHRKRARDLLHHLGIIHPRHHPEKMSIGQQQRVAVARAVACDPVLVLADEPTASLDPENSHKAMQLIQNICLEKNAALLCVSHDPTMCERFEIKASMDDLANGIQPVRPSESTPTIGEVALAQVPPPDSVLEPEPDEPEIDEPEIDEPEIDEAIVDEDDIELDLDENVIEPDDAEAPELADSAERKE